MRSTPILYVLSGAPGAGKSVLAPLLADRAAGVFAVFDMDEILDDSGALLGMPLTHAGAEGAWPAYNDLWLRFAALVVRSGLPVLLLGPLLPHEVEATPARHLFAAVRFALLDCDDHERAARLRRRRWTPERIAAAIEDAAAARDAVPEVVRGGATPQATADAVVAWMRRVTPGR